MAMRHLSLFVPLAAVASPANALMNDSPVVVPTLVLLILFALVGAGGVFLLTRDPSRASSPTLEGWLRARRRA
jgi:hypothetical protein